MEVPFISKVRLTQSVGFCHVSFVFTSRLLLEHGIIVTSVFSKANELRMDREELDLLFPTNSRFAIQIEPDDGNIILADGLLESKKIEQDGLELRIQFQGNHPELAAFLEQ